MPLDAGRMKTHAAAVVAVAALLAAAVGCYAFVISLRPCRLRFEPGTLVDYALRTEWSEIRPDGTLAAPRVREQRVSLVCVGDANEVALVTPEHERGEQVTMMNFAPDGTARRIADERLTDEGKTLGFFDFNLLPLPPGSEQSWNVSLVYALLPPGKRQILARVKRRSNSARPEFELKLPTVEWVEAERYRQVKNLTCTYRFDTSRGVVESAVVKCDTGLERDDGSHRFRVAVTLDLVSVDRIGGGTAALRDLAMATVEADQALARRRLERLLPLIERLGRSGVRAPALRAVAETTRREAADVISPSAPPAVTPRRGPAAPVSAPALTRAPATARPWTLQVASAPAAHRAHAERLAGKLGASGLPAQVAVSGRHVVVRVGPYAERDPAVFDQVKRSSGVVPLWRRAGG
jgi:hypothetical protein